MGKESHVGDVPALPINTFLSNFLEPEYQGDDDDLGGPDLHDIGVAKQYLLENNLNLAGALHILHNAVKDLTNAMSDFEDWWWSPFKSAVQYLKQRDNRKFLVRTCFAEEPASHWASCFDTFVGTTYTKRWGYLISSCDGMMALETPLRLYWNSGVLRQRLGLPGGGGGGGDADADDPILDAASFIDSPPH